MNIVIEGAPATGKSTIAKFLVEHHGFFRIPEVNELFADRPTPEPEHWYYERQIHRCELARERSKSVLDGDPFQAVWFSWIYPNRGFSDWSKSLDFFQARADSLLLPTSYVHLWIDESTRYERERVREQRRGHSPDQFRRKWERYSDFSAVQTALCNAMHEEYPDWVVSIEAVDLEKTVQRLLELQVVTPPAAADFTRWLRVWLSSNPSAAYR